LKSAVNLSVFEAPSGKFAKFLRYFVDAQFLNRHKSSTKHYPAPASGRQVAGNRRAAPELNIAAGSFIVSPQVVE
jgi:hypothetical protein